jgi:digeranylgeranylglycerophospholipid reductase
LYSESVDLAIVGCGVGGASAARAAAASGISVSVFEEHRRVGEPSHCSGHVGIQGFKQYAPNLPKRLIENEIKGAVLHSPDGKQLRLHRNNPVTWVLNRAEFDRYNASIAEKAGVKIYVNSRVDSFSKSDDGRFKLRISGLKTREIVCKMLIDASGCAASISKYVGLNRLSNEMLVNSAQLSVEDVADVDNDLVEVYFGQGYAPGFFGWIIPRRDGSAKVGIAAGARANVRQCFERFIRKHPIVSPKLRRAKTLTPVMYHPIPVGGAKWRTYTDGILTVGDAASQVKPTTGGGIVFGMACGKIAGETAARAIGDDDTSSTCLALYEKSWRRLIGFDLMAMSWLRQLLYRLQDRSLNRIFGISADLKADEILNRTADIDFQGRTLLSLSRDPRLFITLLSASVLSAPSLLGQGRQAQR